MTARLALRQRRRDVRTLPRHRARGVNAISAALSVKALARLPDV